MRHSLSRWSTASLAIRPLSLILLLSLVGCERAVEPADDPATDAATPEVVPADAVHDRPEVFREVAALVGLDFRHVAGARGEFHFPEVMGAGVALFDFDGDHDLDLYLVQGGSIGEEAEGVTRVGDRLYRNDLELGSGVHFTDVTEAAGIEAFEYGMGVAVGDYDADGDVDLYVTNFGPNQLWENLGDGRFVERAAALGVADDRWGSSATFTDFDRDGLLDLFLVNYVDFRLRGKLQCFGSTGRRDYCGPDSFEPVADNLFWNRGASGFEAIAVPAGLAAQPRKGLGVVDISLGGEPTALYVANDTMENQLWVYRGQGRFEDVALHLGAALNLEGSAEAGMGVAAGDYDEDGDLDLFVSHLDGETNTLYQNDGPLGFRDRTTTAGLTLGSRSLTGFGTSWVDYDGDGWLDILVVNGAVTGAAQFGAPDRGLGQPNQLFRNLGNGTFREVSDRAVAALGLRDTSRGAAFGDLDNDGDVDLVTTSNDGPVRLLLNRVGSQSGWLGLRLRDSESGGDAVGARVVLTTASGRQLNRRVYRDGSYLSSSDPRIVIGLGANETPRKVDVYWPDGTAETFVDLKMRTYQDLVKGTGK